jgi:hypothetical protein
LPCFFIIGKVELTDVKEYLSEENSLLDKNKHLAEFRWGKYGFILKNPKRIKKLISTKGNLGFWDYFGKNLIFE